MSQSPAKTFPTGVVLSLTTGVLLVPPFSLMHEIAEWVIGHSVWTHEFADEAFCKRLAEAVFEQHPALRAATEFVPSDPADKPRVLREIDEYLAAQIAAYGPELAIRPGGQARTEGPMQSLSRLLNEKRPAP